MSTQGPSPRWRSLLLAFWMGCLCAVASAQDADRQLSPFEGLRWDGDTPEVQVAGEWYASLSIHGVETSDILEFCEKRWPGKMKKRFGEDLVEALALMGHEVPNDVDLDLERLADGEIVILEKVTMSAANRNAIRDASSSANPFRPRRPVAPATLSRDQALEDLDEFAARLVDQFAYLELGEFDWSGELEGIRERLPDEVSTGALAADLQRVMAGFRDGHASVSSDHLERPRLYPPFLLQECAGGVVAFQPDRLGFLDDEHPFVTAIDGIPIETWIERASHTIVDGSRQLVRGRALRALREFTSLRGPGEATDPARVRVTLAAGEGADKVERDLALTARRPTFGTWPRSESRVLNGDIGYLRLEAMDDDLVPHLIESMTAFRGTKGLIVDVRGNGGGSRSLLLSLAGYLRGPDEKPTVGNIARYIASERFGADHLEARYMRRADDAHWNDEQREVIEAVGRSFEPEWDSPREFSEWHYLILDQVGHDDEYFYDAPVIVLSDSWCFSATDIFLGALSGQPRVTLMGEASAGGSARSQRFTLPHSQISVKCASMASFRPDGRLYDGRGVEVDVEVPMQPSDLLRNGTDSVLAAALARLAD